jgi:hypothetical protein
MIPMGDRSGRGILYLLSDVILLQIEDMRVLGNEGEEGLVVAAKGL